MIFCLHRGWFDAFENVLKMREMKIISLRIAKNNVIDGYAVDPGITQKTSG